MHFEILLLFKIDFLDDLNNVGFPFGSFLVDFFIFKGLQCEGKATNKKTRRKLYNYYYIGKNALKYF